METIDTSPFQAIGFVYENESSYTAVLPKSKLNLQSKESAQMPKKLKE
jgi:hypothetical protein